MRIILSILLLSVCYAQDVLGDLNGDGIVSILDVIFESNCILSATTCDATFDLSQEGNIDILDITTMIDIVLGGSGSICNSDNLETITIYYYLCGSAELYGLPESSNYCFESINFSNGSAVYGLQITTSRAASNITPLQIDGFEVNYNMLSDDTLRTIIFNFVGEAIPSGVDIIMKNSSEAISNHHQDEEIGNDFINILASGSCSYIPITLEVIGCQDETACNYSTIATNSGYCSYPEENYNCIGELLSNDKLTILDNYSIYNIYPNPFNPTTTISFAIPEFGLTTITAYNINGRQLETLTNEVLSIGNYSINWNASDYPSGVYLIRMVSGDFTHTQKVVLVK